ncbi:MAG: CotH kinase family protein, partial [Oscillospiraceae bacterium]|nr:CotH kinase family protein [Oscillospiraceae bacterium]
EDGLSSFSNIVLRSGSQASYLSDSMFTDEFLTSLASESGNMESLMVQDYRPCNLYINDEYFGVYFIREKIDDDFIADNLGVSEESVTIIDKYYDLKYGSSYQGWDDIWKKIYSSKVNFSKDENYQWLADQINLESFSDMIIMRAYSGDLDAGNIRFFKSEEYDNGRWNFILYDNDISFRSNTAAKTRFDKFLHDSEYVKIHALFRALMENDQFKEFFLARLAFHLNSTLSPEYVGAHLDKMIELMEPDMPYQVDCWKHIDDFYLPSMDKWYSNLDFMRSLTTETRIDWFVDDIANALDLSKADIEKYMGDEFVKYLEN